MREKKKPKVGVFGLTSCAGCQLQILNLEDSILDVLGAIDLAHFRMAKEDNDPGPFDIAFVEGSVSKNEHISELTKIRENSKILIALGACACHGGVQSIRSFFKDQEEVKKTVYGDPSFLDIVEVKPLDAYVDVDYYLRGCPINKDEFLYVLKSLLIGKKPVIKLQPVCAECKFMENVCLFEKGEICLGPVTMAGCGAICSSLFKPCEGCRGPFEAVNVESQMEIMEEHGIEHEDVLRRFRKYAGISEQFFEKIKDY